LGDFKTFELYSPKTCPRSLLLQKRSSPCKAGSAEKASILQVLDEMQVDRRARNSRPAITRSRSSGSVSASPVADAEGAMEAAQSLEIVDATERSLQELSMLRED